MKRKLVDSNSTLNLEDLPDQSSSLGPVHQYRPLLYTLEMSLLHELSWFHLLTGMVLPCVS